MTRVDALSLTLATLHGRCLAAQYAAEQAEGEVLSLVMDAREAGESWAAIGRALGVSKQAAQQRYGYLDL